MALEKFLKKLGLEEKDQKVYVALLKLGDASVSRIAKEAKTKRTTTYHILENLKAKGLISFYTERGTKRFVAENPGKLRDILEGQLTALEKYLPQLQSFYNLAKSKAEIKFFEGEEGAKQVSEDVLGSKEKIIYSIGSIKNVKEAIGVSIRFGQRRRAKKIFEKALRIKKEFEEKYFKEKYGDKSQREEFKEVRFLPEDLAIPVLILIYGKKVGVICSPEEGFSFIIESEDFSQTMKLIFEAIWTRSTQNIY
jgi:sugar-specific transcriptional regulator TrmB